LILFRREDAEMKRQSLSRNKFAVSGLVLFYMKKARWDEDTEYVEDGFTISGPVRLMSE